MRWPEDYLGKVIEGDCLEVMREMPDKCVDLVLTSPPYNFSAGSGLPAKYSKRGNDAMTHDGYLEWQTSCISEMLRVSEVVFYNIQFIAGNRIALMKLMGRFAESVKEVIIWDKLCAEPAMRPKVCNSMFEFVLCLGTGSRVIESAVFNRGTFSNILRIGKNNGGIDGHAACMPEKLAGTIIENFSKEGDIIYDPFTGSGTTQKVAAERHRRFVGSEIDPKYCAIARARIAAEQAQGKFNL